MGLHHSPRIVTDGLMQYLDAANSKSYAGSGSAWYDLSGKGNHLTLVNSPTFDSANSGAVVFDGTTQYANSITFPNTTGQLTCEIGMVYNTTSDYYNIFDNNFTEPMLWIDTANKIEVSLSTAAGGMTSTNEYNGQRIIASVTFNSVSSPGRQLYINGKLVDSASDVHPTWTNPVALTMFNRSNAQTFNGKVFFLRFYNRILSATEISNNYNALKERFGI